MLAQIFHFGPACDIGAAAQGRRLSGLSRPVKDAGPVWAVVVMIGRKLLGHGKIFRRCKAAPVNQGGRDAPGIHQSHGGDLPVGGTGPFTVGKVPGAVPDGKAVIRGYVPGAETGAAERGAENHPARNKVSRAAVPDKFQQHRLASWVHGKGKRAGNGAVLPSLPLFQNGRSRHDIFVSSPGASGDDPLINADTALPVKLIGKGKTNVPVFEKSFRVLFNLPEYIAGVFQQGIDLVNIAGVERQGIIGFIRERSILMNLS